MRIRRIVVILGVLGLFLVAGVAIAAHHVNGTWVLTVALGDGQGGDATFELEEQEEGQLTGSYSGTLGQADVTGTVSGNEIEFSFDSQAGKVTYKGTVDGDTMKGTCTYGQLGEGTFEGKRQDAEEE